MRMNVNQLVVAKENPRKTKASDAAHEALVASIKSHGLIQPLVVRPSADNDNVFEVIDGGRRFAAIQEAGLEEIEVIVNDSLYGVGELGTAANMMRAAMHPLDEATVISRLVAEGEEPEAIAGRFGQTAKWAQQRIALDGLSANVKKAFRDGRMGLAAAQAFTLGTKPEQDEYLKKCKEEWQLEAGAVYRALLNSKVKASVAIFPIELYPGKYISRDLFENEVYLTNRQLFDELQKKAIDELVEKLKADGWSDVLLFMNGSDYVIMNKYVKVEGRIGKADRSKYVAVVVYNPGSGAVSCDRGYVLRKDVRKVKVGKETSEDVADAGDVKAHDLYELSDTQRQIVAALQTRGLEQAIADGDTYLAIKTLLEPVLIPQAPPAWSGMRSHIPNYILVNVMLTDKITDMTPEVLTKFPSRATFEKMPWPEVMELVRKAAMRSITVLHVPNDDAMKILKDAGIGWFRFDEGFLRRYRLDALQNLCQKLGVTTDGRKKKELIGDVLSQTRQLIPLRPKQAVG